MLSCHELRVTLSVMVSVLCGKAHLGTPALSVRAGHKNGLTSTIFAEPGSDAPSMWCLLPLTVRICARLVRG